MRTIIFIISILILGMVTTIPAFARSFNPVVIYQGSIEKNPYNISVHKGVERFREKTGEVCTEVVTGTDTRDYVNTVTEYSRKGYSPVFILYGIQFPNLVGFVHDYPSTRFIVLDTVLDEHNIFSFVLAEHEGSFLAGALAAMKTGTGVLGFVSIVDTPFLRRFLCGFSQGARYINPKIRVLEGFTGDYPGAWFDGQAVSALACELMDKNADVIFQAAGGAGPAVLEAVASRGKLGIGVDVNQNGLFPGAVLTSMVKRTDKVAFAALMQAKRGIWRDNYKRLGLAQDAVDIVFDRHNRSIVSPGERSRIEEIRKDIVLGTIPVHDYTENNRCP